MTAKAGRIPTRRLTPPPVLIWIIGREQEAAHASRVMPRSRRLWIFGLFVVLLIVGGVTLWRTPMGSPNTPAAIVVSGNIEAHETVLSFTQIQAPIVELPFDEGAGVAKDTILARVDDSLYRRQTEIDRANLGVANAQVAVSESTLAAAESNQTSDEFDLTEKQRDYARAEDLVKTNAISVQGRDLAYTAARQSAAALAHEQAMVAVATTNVGLAKANEAAVAAETGAGRGDAWLHHAASTVRRGHLGAAGRTGSVGRPRGGDLHAGRPRSRLVARVCERAGYRQDPPRPGGGCDDGYVPWQGLSRPGRLHLAPGRVHAEDRRDARRAGTLVYRIRIDIDNATHQVAARHARRRRFRAAAARQMTGPGYAVSASGVTRNFGPTAAVRGVDFAVAHGEIFGLVGPDGAGKSTIMRDAGRRVAAGRRRDRPGGDRRRRRPQAARPYLSYMPQRFGLYEDLTVDENIFFYATLFQVPRAVRRARAPDLLAAAGLAPFRRRLAGQLSGGMNKSSGWCAR